MNNIEQAQHQSFEEIKQMSFGMQELWVNYLAIVTLEILQM